MKARDQELKLIRQHFIQQILERVWEENPRTQASPLRGVSPLPQADTWEGGSSGRAHADLSSCLISLPALGPEAPPASLAVERQILLDTQLAAQHTKNRGPFLAAPLNLPAQGPPFKVPPWGLMT